MISFACDCGASVKVEDRFAGRLGRCPLCGKNVRIPGQGPAMRAAAAAPSPPIPVASVAREPSPAVRPAVEEALPDPSGLPLPRDYRPRASRPVKASVRGVREPRIPGLIAGLLLLLTIVMPWAVVRHNVVMSWNLVENAPSAVVVVLIGSWVIGLAAVVVFAAVRGLALAITNATLGFLGLILLANLYASAADMPTRLFNEDRSTYILGMLSMACLHAVIITSALRASLSPSLALRIVQGVPSGMLIILMLISIIQVLNGFAEMHQLARERVAFDVVFGVIIQVMLMAAGILALIQAVSPSLNSTLSRIAFILCLAAVGAVAIWLLLRPALSMGEPGVIFAFLNVLLVILDVSVLFCAGVIGVVLTLAPRPGKETTAAGPLPGAPAGGDNPEERLRRLMSLLREGVITPEEFTAAKAKLLQSF